MKLNLKFDPAPKPPAAVPVAKPLPQITPSKGLNVLLEDADRVTLKVTKPWTITKYRVARVLNPGHLIEVVSRYRNGLAMVQLAPGLRLALPLDEVDDHTRE